MKKLILILFIIAVCVGAYGQYIKASATGGKIQAQGIPRDGLVGYWSMNEDDLCEAKCDLSEQTIDAGVGTNASITVSGDVVNMVVDVLDGASSIRPYIFFGNNFVESGKKYKIIATPTVNSGVGSFRLYDTNRYVYEESVPTSFTHEFTAVSNICFLAINGSSSGSSVDIDWEIILLQLNSAISNRSGNGNDGQIAVTPATFTADQNGAYNKAMVFDGSSDYLDCGSDNSLTVTSGGFTISFWYIYNGGGRLLHKGGQSNSNYDYTVFIYSDNSILCGIGKTTGAIPSEKTDSVYSISEWHHVAAVADGVGGISIYVDGVFSSSSATTNSNASNDGLTIGSKNDGTQLFNGNISDTYIYSRALSQSEVTQLYNSGLVSGKIKAKE